MPPERRLMILFSAGRFPLANKTEWLLFNANLAILKLFHGENKLSFNAMMKRSALY